MEDDDVVVETPVVEFFDDDDEIIEGYVLEKVNLKNNPAENKRVLWNELVKKPLRQKGAKRYLICGVIGFYLLVLFVIVMCFQLMGYLIEKYIYAYDFHMDADPSIQELEGLICFLSFISLIIILRTFQQFVKMWCCR